MRTGWTGSDYLTLFNWLILSAAILANYNRQDKKKPAGATTQPTGLPYDLLSDGNRDKRGRGTFASHQYNNRLP